MVQHLVDRLDELGSHDKVDDDEDGEPSGSGEVNPRQVPLPSRIEVEAAPVARIQSEKDPEANCQSFAQVMVVELGVVDFRVFLLELIEVHSEGDE